MTRTAGLQECRSRRRLPSGRRPAHSGHVRYLVALPVVAFVVALAWGALTGRVRARGCCAPDAASDLRLRDVRAVDRPVVTSAPVDDHSG